MINEKEPRLQHFGIKGMKWGIRKDTPGASTETKAERKQAQRNLQSFMYNAVKDDLLVRTMTEAEYNGLSKKGETFAKGVNLKRVAMDGETKAAGALYVSKMMEDHEFYKAAIPSYGPATKFPGGGQKKYNAYEVDMTTVKKLKLPSEKERFDTFMELLSKPEIKLPNKTAPVTGREYLEKLGYKSHFKTQTDQQLAFRAYHDFVTSQGDKSIPLNKAYFDQLSKKGYNALIDGEDAGKRAKKPLIILDAENNLKVNALRPLTADEINRAQRELIIKND